MRGMSTSDAPAPTGDDTSAAHPRFAEAPRALGLDVEIRRFPEATRTAAEAAAALGCGLGEIFDRRHGGGRPGEDRVTPLVALAVLTAAFTHAG